MVPPETPVEFGPGRLWSLWDMINFSFSGVVHLLGEITLLITVSKHNMDFAASIGESNIRLMREQPKHEEAIKQALEGVDLVVPQTEKLLGWLKCSHIDDAAKKLDRWRNRQESWAELNTRARHLRDCIQVELRDYLFYQYPKNKAQLLKDWKTEWVGCLKAFPTTAMDVWCAVDCYALGHDTASAFHSMRILERGLTILAKDVGVDAGVQNWQNIIDQIEAAVRAIGKSLPAGSEKTERLKFLSEAAKEFVWFKDGWRNHVAHARATYDEHQARGTLEHVRAFMNHLSAQLSE